MSAATRSPVIQVQCLIAVMDLGSPAMRSQTIPACGKYRRISDADKSSVDITSPDAASGSHPYVWPSGPRGARYDRADTGRYWNPGNIQCGSRGNIDMGSEPGMRAPAMRPPRRVGFGGHGRRGARSGYLEKTRSKSSPRSSSSAWSAFPSIVVTPGESAPAS